MADKFRKGDRVKSTSGWTGTVIGQFRGRVRYSVDGAQHPSIIPAWALTPDNTVGLA